MPPGFIELFHGTDVSSAWDILERGFNMQTAFETMGTGDALWTTTSRDYAWMFAQANPAGGTPAMVKILVPDFFIDQMRETHYLSILGTVHRFEPEAVNGLNIFGRISMVYDHDKS